MEADDVRLAEQRVRGRRPGRRTRLRAERLREPRRLAADPAGPHDEQPLPSRLAPSMNSSENTHGVAPRTKRSPSAMRRRSASISPTASSAVARVSTSGVFATTTSRSAAAARSTLFDADRVVRDDPSCGPARSRNGAVDARRQHRDDPVRALGRRGARRRRRGPLDLERDRGGDVDPRARSLALRRSGSTVRGR